MLFLNCDWEYSSFNVSLALNVLGLGLLLSIWKLTVSESSSKKYIREPNWHYFRVHADWHTSGNMDIFNII